MFVLNVCLREKSLFIGQMGWDVGSLIYVYMGSYMSTTGPYQQLVFWWVNNKSAAKGWARGKRQDF